MSIQHHLPPRHFRTVWISDVHLGFRGCSAEHLLDFLHSFECDQLYLVGDIIDIWQIKRKPYWPQEHNNVLRTILGKAKRGTQVIYVPGNHDELLRDYEGTQFGNIRIASRVIHTRADGSRMLVLHGDQFDGVVKCSKILALIGSKLYEWLLQANIAVNWVRRKLGLSYWSLAGFLKGKVKNAVQYVSNFERAVAHEAEKQAVQSVVCGHIHRAEITEINGILYCNCGDWVESCSALVEQEDGTIELLYWSRSVAADAPLAQVA
ncbi:MAG: UDP-2,3-diacylglucosamine diphosphatase [Pseudomonadota bacterium]|nr:UDP-2,3-diacylglucosamine diphosphatase [Pseudomonadota bacterium]